MRRLSWLSWLFGFACVMSSTARLLAADVAAGQVGAGQVAADVDQLILKELKAGKVEPAKLSNDERAFREQHVRWFVATDGDNRLPMLASWTARGIAQERFRSGNLRIVELSP